MITFNSVKSILFGTLIFTIISYAKERNCIFNIPNTWIHSSSQNYYHFFNKVNTDEETGLLQTNVNTKYDHQIHDNNNEHIFLISSNESNIHPYLRIHLPNLENQIKNLSNELKSIDSAWNCYSIELYQKITQNEYIINHLKAENQKLKKELILVQKKLNIINLQFNDKQRAIIMQWFMYGGGVFSVGLFLGLLLSYMIKNHKQKDRW